MPPRAARPLLRRSRRFDDARPTRTRVLGVALGVALAACGSREAPPAPAPPAPPVVAAPARPATVRVEGRLRDLGALRAVLPPMLAAAAPTRAGELLAAGCALPAALQSRIADDARVAFALARPSADESLGFTFAAGVRVDAGPAPLGADTPLVDAGLPDVRWVGAAPAEGRAALALVGDALLCAENAALARAVGPYVARTLLPRITSGDPAPRAPVHATLLPGAVSEDLHRFLSAELALATLKLRQAAARQAHAAPPPTGATPATPAPLGSVAIALRDALRPAVESLAGAGSGSITIDTDHSQLVVRVTVDAPPGSPFAAALATLPRIDRDTLSRLPAGTSLGAVFGADPASTWATGGALRAAIDDAAGAPLPPGDATKLDAALASIGAARGVALVVATGLHAGAAFALVGAVGATAGPDAAGVQTALDTAYLRGAVAQSLGCVAPGGAKPTPRASMAEGTTVQALRICGAPARGDSSAIPARLVLARRDSAWTLLLSRGASEGALRDHAAEVTARLAQATPASAESALAALPERFSVGLAVRPAALGALLAATTAPGATAPTAADDDATLHLALDHDARGAHLTVVAPGAAIAAFVGAFAGAPGARP